MQPLHFEGGDHPEIQGDGKTHSDQGAGGGNQKILRLEVAHDGLTGRTQCAANADLTAALRHPVAGETHDAERRDGD